MMRLCARSAESRYVRWLFYHSLVRPGIVSSFHLFIIGMILSQYI